MSGGFNGAGQFSFTYNWVNDAANGVPITASRMDGQFNDAVSGFDLCVTRDNQGKPSATMLPDTDNAYDLGGSGAAWKSGYFGTSVGIGMTPSNILDITASATNIIQYIQILNGNAGDATAAAIRTKSSSSVATLFMYGPNFTTSGVSRADGGKLECDGGGGLTVNTIGARPFYIGINSTEVARFDSPGLAVGATAFGASATNTIAISNGVAPASSPASTGQLYVESGALKYRGSSGTVTVLAPA